MEDDIVAAPKHVEHIKHKYTHRIYYTTLGSPSIHIINNIILVAVVVVVILVC